MKQVTDESTRQTEAVMAFLRDTVPPDGLIASQNPEAVFLATSRQGFPMVEEPDARFLKLGNMSAWDYWVERADRRPMFLYGPCPQAVLDYFGKSYQEVDIYGSQLRLILNATEWKTNQLFRSPNCKHWIASFARNP